jgi:hypothetical protein
MRCPREISNRSRLAAHYRNWRASSLFADAPGAGSLLSGLVVVEAAGRLSDRVAGGVLAALGAGVTRVVYPLSAQAGEHMGLRGDRSLEIALDKGKRIVCSEALEPEKPAGVDVLLTSRNGATHVRCFPASWFHVRRDRSIRSGRCFRGHRCRPSTSGLSRQSAHFT